MPSEYTRTLTSFSGADLIVSFEDRVIGELQQISWGIEREKVPVYTLGSPDPRSFSRGKRGIAGSLVFAYFDRDALYEELVQKSAKWDRWAPAAMFTAAGNVLSRTADVSGAIEMSQWDQKASEATGGQKVGPTGELVNVPPGFDVITKESIVYADMIPPFTITMTFANEYGQAAFQRIYHAEILNEGSGVNVDTVVMERSMTFIARRISPLISGVFTGQGLTGKPVL